MDDLKERLEQIAHMDLRVGGIPAHTIDTVQDALAALEALEKELDEEKNYGVSRAAGEQMVAKSQEIAAQKDALEAKDVEIIKAHQDAEDMAALYMEQKTMMKELIAKLEAATEDQQYDLMREAVALVHKGKGVLFRFSLKAIDFAEAHRFPELLIGVAVTLVPEGYSCECTIGDYGNYAQVGFQANGGYNFSSILREKTSSKGSSPALALTIAVLKAREET